MKQNALFSGFILLFAIHFFCYCSSMAQVPDKQIPFSPIGSLSLDAGTDWLAKFYGSKISDSVRIVGLGEVSHGSYEPMAFKAKMIQYLVEEKGYRNILFEASDFTNIRPIRDYLSSNTLEDNKVERFQKLAPSTVPMNRFYGEVFGWIKKYNMAHPNDKVQVAGIDVNDESTLFNYVLNKFIIPSDPVEGEKFVYRMANIADPSKLTLIRNWFDGNKTALSNRFPKSEIDWLDYHLADSEHGVQLVKMKMADSSDTSPAYFYRDSIMAMNVRRLAGSKKAIITAHNAHVARMIAPMMGNHLSKSFSSGYYVILTDFSKQAHVHLVRRTQKQWADYYTKTFNAEPTTAAAEISHTFRIPSGMFLHKDILKYRIIDRTNAIDVFGLQSVIFAYPRVFDALVVFENITTNGNAKP